MARRIMEKIRLKDNVQSQFLILLAAVSIFAGRLCAQSDIRYYVSDGIIECTQKITLYGTGFYKMTLSGWCHNWNIGYYKENNRRLQFFAVMPADTMSVLRITDGNTNRNDSSCVFFKDITGQSVNLFYSIDGLAPDRYSNMAKIPKNTKALYIKQGNAGDLGDSDSCRYREDYQVTIGRAGFQSDTVVVFVCGDILSPDSPYEYNSGWDNQTMKKKHGLLRKRCSRRLLKRDYIYYRLVQ